MKSLTKFSMLCLSMTSLSSNALTLEELEEITPVIVKSEIVNQVDLFNIELIGLKNSKDLFSTEEKTKKEFTIYEKVSVLVCQNDKNDKNKNEALVYTENGIGLFVSEIDCN